MPSVKRAAVVTIERDGVDLALARLRAVAEQHGVELVEGDDADIAIVLGGDGTMLRALARFLGTGVPVIGVNFGRVGFLTSMSADELESGLERVFAGEYSTVQLSTLEATVNGTTKVAVNDVVVAGGTLGRMVEIGYSIGGEDLGHQPCDGLICATPTGSTAYNLSNGGPVLVWGLDAMAITFVAPHSLHARPLVVPRGRALAVTNRTPDVSATVLADGQQVHELAPGDEVEARLAEQRSLLATLPESTFFSRYRRTFVSE
jgi:NAD+ kinase